MTIRRLAPGDESVVGALATDRRLSEDEAGALLADEDTILLVAFDGSKAVGFVLAYVLRRRHGAARQLFVYEVEVESACRRRGVATALLREVESFAVASGIGGGFLLAERDNLAAMGLYRSVGARDEGDNVVWDFEYTAR